MPRTSSAFSRPPSAFGLQPSAFLLMVLMSIFMSNTPVWSQTVRDPAYAGSFYPADAKDLKQFIEDMTARAAGTPLDLPAHKKLKALIMPHAGYIYSGYTAAHVSRVLAHGDFSKIILMSPDHRVGFHHIAVSDVDAYKTPLGKIPVHESAKTLNRDSDLFRPEPLSDASEHSVEVVLPFLQVYLKAFSFIPMVVGQVDDRACFNAIDALTDETTLIVVSSDLSHYLPYPDAVATDKDTIDKLLAFDIEAIADKKQCACGRIPILALLRMAKKYGWKPVLLNYSNSGDTAGNKDQVVGYAAIAFFGDNGMNAKQDSAQFTEEQGQALVKLARRTISRKLGKEVPTSESMEKLLASEPFRQHRGTFVTLKKKGQLRGCIGSLAAYEPIADGVRDNAINAAFRDPRFRPLSAEELNDLQVEVSILTEPKPLTYTDAQDLINKLRVHVDGVILRKGGASATFLPQVWEQLPDPAQFLSHLCQKAGLPKDAWKTSKLEISTYQVEYFEEP